MKSIIIKVKMPKIIRNTIEENEWVKYEKIILRFIFSIS